MRYVLMAYESDVWFLMTVDNEADAGETKDAVIRNKAIDVCRYLSNKEKLYRYVE